MKEVRRTLFNGFGKIVDTQTGEIYEPESKDYKITIEEYINGSDSNENESEYFMSDVTFIKSFRGNGIMLNQKLTNPEIAAVVFLCDFICYEDCVIRKSGNKSGAPLSVRDLSCLIGINYETFRKTMSSLKKKQVIGYHSTGDSKNGTSIKWITVNPYIFCRGTKVEKWVVEFYANSEWAQLERQRIKIGNKK